MVVIYAFVVICLATATSLCIVHKMQSGHFGLTKKAWIGLVITSMLFPWGWYILLRTRSKPSHPWLS